MRFLVILALLSTTSVAQGDLAKLQPEIDKAVEKAVSKLLDSQYRDGSWGPHGEVYPGLGFHRWW